MGLDFKTRTRKNKRLFAMGLGFKPVKISAYLQWVWVSNPYIPNALEILARLGCCPPKNATKRNVRRTEHGGRMQAPGTDRPGAGRRCGQRLTRCVITPAKCSSAAAWRARPALSRSPRPWPRSGLELPAGCLASVCSARERRAANPPTLAHPALGADSAGGRTRGADAPQASRS